MAQNKKEPSRLLTQTVIDARDELDERLEKCYSIVTSIITGLSERQINDALNAYVCKGSQQHEEVQLGLLYMILVDQKQAARAYRDMMLISRDGLTFVLTRTNQLIFEKWLKLQDTPRTQIVWFCKELVKNSVNGTESVCNSLLRQIAGGDISPKNVWLAESMLDMFMEHRPWLDKIAGLLATVVYTYLRVIVDHNGAAYESLRKREVEFTVSLLREKWMECAPIGRDLVRLLQNVARIPEFYKLWQEILNNPTALSSQFTGISQLLKTRTSRKFLISRLTPDMETKLAFLLTKSNVAASNAKLSLFYDWLFFDPEKDSIMNIEPCILVMYHSIRPHPAITATLLDFMCRIIPNFHPSLVDQVRQGIYKSLRSILEKRVLASISPLFDNPKLDKELRAMIREQFTEFCSVEVKEEVNNGKEVAENDSNHHPRLNHSDSIPDAAFSDEEDDIPLGKLRSEMKFRPIKEPPKYKPVDITDYIDQLPDGDMKASVLELQNETDNEIQCEVMEKLTQAVIQEDDFDQEVAITLATCLCQLLVNQLNNNLYNDDFDQEVAITLATCLCQLLVNQLNNNLFPQVVDEESVEDSIGSPLFVLFRNLCQTPEEDPSRQPLLTLIGEMYAKQSRIGYYMLYYLKVGKIVDDKMSTYKDFCKTLENRDIESCLMTDLRLCQEDDVRLFTYLIPDIYTQFPNIAIGSAELLHLIVSSIDGSQLQDLVCQILQGHLIMFRKDSFLSILNASLEWETIEQYFLWQLIAAHNIPVEHIMPILPKLEFQTHAEALSSILIQLKQECPSAELLRPIFCRECKKHDYFSVSILKYWAQEYEDKLADLVLAQISKSNPSTPNRKRQRSTSTSISANKKENPTIEQTLSHLDHMRQVCRNISFITHESMQQALQYVQCNCTDSIKMKYGDLLALAEDFEDVKTTRVLRGRTKANISPKPTASKQKKSPAQAPSDSSSESSEDEIVKPKTKKRKRGATPLDEDEDD
ncbi:integrator complex subunit 3 [Lingula anatina]|uniref:Integrator complex subunit 3 n=1 Tax=Lingula anatina TaxID=7574 RepID=A0A2R2MMJ1_LINAN|nr:integrator complex subunit 3 [Lingula anatina]|eukprot:XP_023931443.1 integrator complex subunit 3 [Lingula anatina]